MDGPLAYVYTLAQKATRYHPRAIVHPMPRPKKTSVIYARVTPEEHKAILAAADAAGLGVAEYIRALVIEAKPRRVAPATVAR